jgi:hypothetical protein
MKFFQHATGIKVDPTKGHLTRHGLNLNLQDNETVSTYLRNATETLIQKKKK